MNTIYCNNLKEIRKQKKFLESKLKTKISFKGRQVTIEGNPLNEYEASLIIDAINLGFPGDTAILLEDENYVFEILNIKDYTRRKNLELIKGRIIGTKGKTKRTIEQISGCFIKIKDNTIGIIGPAENIEYALTGITNLIRGTKQTNIYKYLERINTKHKKELKK